MVIMMVLGPMTSCRQGNSRTAADKDTTGATARTPDPGAMDRETTPALVGRLKGSDPASVQARDALADRWARLAPAERAKVADAVLTWTVGDLEKRAGAGRTGLARVLETMGPAAPAGTLAAFAQKHAAWLLAQDAGEVGEVLQLVTVAPYGPHMRKALLAGALLAFDVTLPTARQQRVLSMITGCAQGPERKAAGEVILKNLQVKEKISLESVRALGELQTEGATEYLRLFVQMDVPLALRRVAVEALAAIVDDPVATEVLYDLAKPVFFSILSGDALEEKLLERARWAFAGLGKSRACALAPKEYASLRKVYRKTPSAALAPLREEALPSLIRLMWCADPKKTRADVPAALRTKVGLTP
ncbi:MAG: hypothetical protein CVU65_06815 [Deltaproteobacteria bacterium HGW-Deltaproteobacteria-22]|nr:MAG: hypothetical protein CVU65_06815 [Deltaproteobacteria bacterium HGW-Deltaproteobacteria-22]